MAKKKPSSPKGKHPKKKPKIRVGKKELNLKPPHAKEIKKQLAEERKATEATLKELAAKTAALADKVKGKETPKERVLQLDEPEGKEPVDIFSYIDEEAEVPGGKPATDSAETQDVNTEKADESKKAEEPKKPNPAADLIRGKLDKLYGSEPDAAEEAAEAIQAGAHRSKHQTFMYNLTTSGKSLADIQTEWHEYYVGLPDSEKHEVWQEFYANQQSTSAYVKALSSDKATEKSSEIKDGSEQTSTRANAIAAVKKLPAFRPKVPDKRSVAEIRAQLIEKVSAGGKLQAKHHVKSLLFGLSLAAFVGLAMSFTFFNEVFIAPFISPSRSVSATPIIGDIDQPVGPEPKIIIPKINLEVPVVYDVGSVQEEAIQNALEDGVVHYAASPEPGERGNSVIVGHSSNNILNSGKYKFAFVLLRRLEVDDTFFIHKDGIRYTYKIYDKKIVEPNDISVLGDAERANSMTLITCDPPGTTLRRLIIVAEQISPDPITNTEAEVDVQLEEPVQLPSNAPSLWSRLWPF